jgi:dihydrofolate reductase
MDDTPLAAGSPTQDSPANTAIPLPSARPSAQLAIIAAVAKNQVIGDANRMPWHLSPDLKRFRALTMGHRVIMGRKTYDSLGKPLAGRENVVVSRNARLEAPGCRVVTSLAAALEHPTLPPPAFCIGGAQLYAEALPLADEIYLTRIDAEFSGDALMPMIDPAEWREVTREDGSDPATGLAYAFVHLVRIRQGRRLAMAATVPN